MKPTMITIRACAYHKRSRGIYIILNDTQPNKAYIGSSECVSLRVRQHASDLRRGSHCRRELQQDYDAGDRFTIHVLGRNVDMEQDLLLLEQDQMDRFEAAGYTLYNGAPAFVGDRLKAISAEQARYHDWWEGVKSGRIS